MHIISLFGRRAGLVHEYWPRFGKVDDATGERKVTGWKPEIAGEILQTACAHAGLFDPQGKVRGRGAWRGPDGELIIHHGDKVYRAGSAPGFAWEEPDVIDGFVYPTAPAMPRPDIGAVGDAAGVEAAQPAALLALGAAEDRSLSAARLHRRGAVRRRARLAPARLGDRRQLDRQVDAREEAARAAVRGALLRTHDATEASIRQVLGKQTLPVFFDELEAEANNDRAQRVIKLARLASSSRRDLPRRLRPPGDRIRRPIVLLFHLDPDAGDARPGPQPNGDPRAASRSPRARASRCSSEA
jgi:hypothetical protein